MNCHSPSPGLILRRCWVLLLILGAFYLGGCRGSDQSIDEPPTKPALQPLAVTFVDFPGVAKEVARQWAARRDGELKIQELSTDELLANNYAAVDDQDLLIYPGSLLGQLFSDDKLTQVPNEVWNSDELNSRGLLRHSRTTLSRFNRERWATPLGSPQLFLFLRTDVLKAVNVDPPQQWNDLLELAATLERQKDISDENGNPLPTEVLIPTGPYWAARIHLAIAASRIRQRGRLDTLFERRTMTPLIDCPPFQQALEDLKQLSRESSSQNRTDRPTDSVAQFLSGKAAVAIGWSSVAATANDDSATSEAYAKTQVLRLPGSVEWFDFSSDEWESRLSDQVAHVDLVGFHSFQASILRSSAHPTSAYQFMSWVSSKQMGAALFARSPDSAPTRSSHLGNLTAWCGDQLEQATVDTMADLYREINEGPVFLMFPRLLGSHEYWGVLDNEIQGFLNDDFSAEEALKNVASQWEELTERYGRDKQIELLRLNQSL